MIIFCYNKRLKSNFGKIMFDLAILGGGPAGVAVGVYAARKQIKTIFITKEFGGQSVVSDGIENWIGDIKISGPELSQKMEKHLREYAGNFVTIETGHYITKVSKIERGPGSKSGMTFEIETDKNKFQAKTIFVGTGSHRKKLDAEGADKFEHKGVTYCASCDGPIFSGQDVAVIGGGNAGFESAAQLLAYAKSVTLLHYKSEVKGDPVTVEAVKKDSKFTLITNAKIKKVLGDKFVDGLVYEDTETKEEKELKVSGIFVETGSTPTTEFLKDVVNLDEFNRVKIDPWTQRTETEGIWAAGDCTNAKYHQNNIAAGDAVKAAEDIYIHLKRN